MTTPSETDNNNDINENTHPTIVAHESPIDQSDKKQEEPITIDEKNNSTHETEEKNSINDETLINTSLRIVDTNVEQKEITVNNIEDDNRSKRPYNSKVKYSSMPYYQSSYYANGYPYAPAPYYYYPITSANEKPTPMMFVSNQSGSLTTSDNQTGNSTTMVSSQNLPPRSRQTSISETDSNVQVSTTAAAPPPPISNGRRHRSILPRGSCNYYPHPPPPLMATPPGVLFTYPPTAHQTGHIAYNIRTPDELELLAFQQQFMDMPPPPLIWPPPGAYPHFPSYATYGPSPYIHDNSAMINSTSSLLNPDAAEWIPTATDLDASSSDNNILIDDEINFPPLNNNRIEENNSEQKTSIDTSTEMDSINKTEDNTTATTTTTTTTTATVRSKVDSTIPNLSSSQDDTKNLSSSKLTTITYSTVILQTSDVNKSNKTVNTNNQYQRRQQQLSNNAHAQLPSRDRITKQQRTQNPPSKDTSSHQRQPLSNRNNFNKIRNIPSIEIPKQQQQFADDWIEVKSKKTKKFDRSINDIQFEHTSNISQKLVSDEQIQKTLPPPSLSSVGDNTTATSTSEDDDDKDELNNIHDSGLVMIVENQTSTTTTTTTATTDYNQIIVDDIHRRLNNAERLLIIIRGCPGSGKSTLAKSLNDGYTGQICSIDDYFKNINSNEYISDSSKLDNAHYYNRQQVSDAFKQNISPIIIDNTNITSSEMKPYVEMGKEADYNILLIEPQTPWRYKARELVKRNLHNLPLRRIKEMLTRFEHNVTVQSIIEQTKTNIFIPSPQILDQHQTDTESIDPILTSKKFYDIIEDSNILDDVRLCINDMILFLTSNFYQTSQSLTSLSFAFSDSSFVPSSSSPSTSSTPHSLFHRSLSRFSSTTPSQDHSFTNEHILRLPTTSFSRCLDNLTSPSVTNSNLIGKKRRKNKNKQQQQQQQQSDEILLNTNNNNNRNNENECYLQQATFNVFLPEDCLDLIVIDEQDNNNWFDNCTQNFNSQKNSRRDHSSPLPQHRQSSNNEKYQLLNIIHDGLTTPSASTTDQHPSISVNHVAIQCSSDELNQQLTHSYPILIGHLISTESPVTLPISPPPGYIECGIQVDLNENNIDSLSNLIQFYSERVSTDIINQFYELCNADIQWTRSTIDEYVQHTHITSIIPTLRQLSLNTLNQWDEQIKYSNPSFDTISIGDLLQDINDEEAFEELILDDDETPNSNSIQFLHTNQILIPWSMIDSLQELYGELPIKSSSFSYNPNGITIPIDDDLSMSIYQALQRCLGISTKPPVIEKKVPKKNTNQQWKLPTKSNEANMNLKKKSNGPSLQQIMNEELNYNNTHKPIQKLQLDFASQHKLKELERHFPLFDHDVLYDVFCENENDYDLTLVCISSMLDENASIATKQKSQSVPTSSKSRSVITTKISDEPILESYDTSRRNALDYALKRKDCYVKADQANRHGMTGVASHYINQAREQTRLMKDANRVAYEYLSRTRLIQFRQTHRLDLHELHSDEALNLFKQVEQELNEGNKRTTPKSIEVITGYGKSSVYGGGYGKIRSVILAYLRQRSYKYSEPNKGAILVQLTNARN